VKELVSVFFVSPFLFFMTGSFLFLFSSYEERAPLFSVYVVGEASCRWLVRYSWIPCEAFSGGFVRRPPFPLF